MSSSTGRLSCACSRGTCARAVAGIVIVVHNEIGMKLRNEMNFSRESARVEELTSNIT